jgi:glutathione-specific gamma-glutamylcyclotransferase
MQHPVSSAPPVWLFAYGSLLWRPDFPYAERVRGYVRGWSRRFWQGSTDHRGLPGAPGRVVTLAPDPEAACWGLAYRLEPSIQSATLLALDVREQGGYQRHSVEFHCRDGERAESWSALLYVAGPDNPEYLGPAPLEEIARQVSRSAGPSGTNREYALQLHAALATLGVDDAHVAGLAQLLLASAAPAVARQNEAADAQPQPRAAANSVAFEADAGAG